MKFSLGMKRCRRTNAGEFSSCSETNQMPQVGFERVNQHVKHAMVQWIGVVVREKFQTLIDRAESEDVFTV